METGQHGLKRELKLWDLITMQVIVVVWLGWTGFAAKQGPTQLMLWLLAIVLFYLPLAAVVIKLSRSIPVEGGVYQWVKEGLSPFAGYLAGWNYSLYAISIFATAGSVFANSIAYAAGPHSAWMLNSAWLAIALTGVGCLVAYLSNGRGLHLAKWWGYLGSQLTIAMFVALVLLLLRAWMLGLPSVRGAFSLAWPAATLVTLNVFTKMAVSALSGFDATAIFSEECRKPENDVSRSVLVAAPLIALMYILGTSAVLAYVPPAQVDLAASVPQTLQAGLGVAGWGGALTKLTVLAFGVTYLASLVIYVGMVARLPMVAGWDGLLPSWWSELHPRWRTPNKAIAAVTLTMFALGCLLTWGASNQEALQVSVGAGYGSYCITYLLLFGVVLFGFRSGKVRPGLALWFFALAAFLVTLCALIFQVVPLGDVTNRAVFAMKVLATVLAVNALGSFLYWRGTQRASNAQAVANPLAETEPEAETEID